MSKIDTGYEGSNVPEDFEIPECNIEQIDRAVFNLFDDKLRFEVRNRDRKIRVPVVFASGERFALTRRKNPIRDKENTLILPLISIMRQNIDFSYSQSNKRTAIALESNKIMLLSTA